VRAFRPAFSPGSCYLLRDAEEEAYFARHGGAPEAPLIDWATQFIALDETFVDIGAHVGTWTQHFALKCKQVHAFEPQQTTYERLLDVFWHNIDPVTANQQFCDHGTQYRSAIFYRDDRQRDRH